MRYVETIILPNIIRTMQKLRDKCMEFFKNEDIKKHLIDPAIGFFYNELYLYIWIFCIYHVFFVFLLIANVYVSIKIYSRTYYREE